MNQRYDVLGFGLICVAAALFTVAGVSDNLFDDKSWLFRWQGFLGALLGALGTILAGWLAYVGVQQQIARSDAHLRERQDASRAAAIVAITQPIHAASITLRVLKDALEKIGAAAIEADKDVEIHVRQLAGTLAHFSLRELVPDLRAEDRAFYLMVLLRLEVFVSVFVNGTNTTRERRLRRGIRDLTRAHPFIVQLDTHLGEVFARDGRITEPT